MIYTTVVSFALGIFLDEALGLGWQSILLLLTLGLLISGLLLKESRYFAKVSLLIFIFISLGVWRMSFTHTALDDVLIKQIGENISLVGKVAREPDIRDNNVRYIVDLYDYESNALLVANRFPEFKYGDEIKFEGKLQLPKNFEGEAGIGFDYIKYLSKDGVHFLIYYPEIASAKRGGNSIVSYLYDLKNIFVEKISETVVEPNTSLLSGLIFGVKQSLGSELLEKFKDSGLIHIVVLSGYNITIIAWAINSFFSRFGSRNFGFSMSALCIGLFAIMVGLGATVIRASIMALIAILARFLGRPADALRWLFIAGGLMLLYNPLSLVRDPSFQLSFMATLGLIIFSPFVFSFITKKLPFISEKFALREIIASTIAVQVFILPLLIKMSGAISIISFIVNPLVLPLVPYAMAFGALAGAFGIIAKIISWPFGIMAYFLTEIIIKIVEASSSLPFATMQIDTLPFYAILIWYALYGLLYLKMKDKVGL